VSRASAIGRRSTTSAKVAMNLIQWKDLSFHMMSWPHLLAALEHRWHACFSV
jgi:hypothetical protein